MARGGSAQRTPAAVTVTVGALLPSRSSSGVQTRVRPHPFSAMQPSSPSPICDQRVNGEVNHARPVLAFRLLTAEGTDTSHAARSAR